MSELEAPNLGDGTLDDSELENKIFTSVPPSEELTNGRPKNEKKKKKFFFLTRDPP